MELTNVQDMALEVVYQDYYTQTLTESDRGKFKLYLNDWGKERIEDMEDKFIKTGYIIANEFEMAIFEGWIVEDAKGNKIENWEDFTLLF